MKLGKYLWDKIIHIIVYVILSVLIVMLLNAFKVNNELITAVIVLLSAAGTVLLFIDFVRKRRFYNNIIHKLEELDKKYLITEVVTPESFYESELFTDILYITDKSMAENIRKYKESIDNFKEYVEMWIHEVKIPLASLMLINHNSNNENKKYTVQLNRIDNFLEQILYYVRSEYAEKDFIIKYTDLNKVIGNVALKNKDLILENNIELEADIKENMVLTDGKWLEFIINQVLNNSIKYKRENGASIKIYSEKSGNITRLNIEDNGIGIDNCDLSRVFEKSFTGKNGRHIGKSTGMGLYIVKKLCDRLGHTVDIQSKKGEYTCLTITFADNEYYNITKM